MLEIKNLHVKLEEEDKVILKGVNLSVGAGEVHAIMGPNGSGKSTLSYVLAGRAGYEVTQGSALLGGEELLDLDPEIRAAKGLFLAFQYPVEIPGVGNMTFLRTALNAQRKVRGEDEVSAGEFLKLVREKAKDLQIDTEMMKRPVNVGFSGGEKKRNEILQMAMLAPKMCILDETDSGLDVDAMKLVSQGVNALRDAGRSFLVITHYQRLLDHITPDFVQGARSWLSRIINVCLTILCLILCISCRMAVLLKLVGPIWRLKSKRTATAIFCPRRHDDCASHPF